MYFSWPDRWLLCTADICLMQFVCLCGPVISHLIKQTSGPLECSLQHPADGYRKLVRFQSSFFYVHVHFQNLKIRTEQMQYKWHSYTLHATHYTLHTTRYILHATCYTLHAIRYTLHATHTMTTDIKSSITLLQEQQILHTRINFKSPIVDSDFNLEEKPPPHQKLTFVLRHSAFSSLQGAEIFF